MLRPLRLEVFAVPARARSVSGESDDEALPEQPWCRHGRSIAANTLPISTETALTAPNHSTLAVPGRASARAAPRYQTRARADAAGHSFDTFLSRQHRGSPATDAFRTRQLRVIETPRNFDTTAAPSHRVLSSTDSLSRLSATKSLCRLSLAGLALPGSGWSLTSSTDKARAKMLRTLISSVLDKLDNGSLLCCWSRNPSMRLSLSLVDPQSVRTQHQRRSLRSYV